MRHPTHLKTSTNMCTLLVGICRHAVVNRLNILATADFIKTAPCSRLHHVRQFRFARQSLKSVDHCQACSTSRLSESLRMSNYGSVDGKDNCDPFRRLSLSVKMQRSLRKMRKSIKKITESIQEDHKHSLYIFPEQLSTLTCRTGFSKNEIRKLYRAFKQLCPRGCATSGDLKPAYAKLFPLGDPARYAQIVFNSFDQDGDGIISFSDLLGVLTLIINGNADQKLSWIFRFYDLNGDGCITRQEMLAVVSAIYEMVQNTHTIQSVVNKQVDRFFEKMDTDRDGMISRKEFMSGCKNVREYPTM